VAYSNQILHSLDDKQKRLFIILAIFVFFFIIVLMILRFAISKQERRLEIDFLDVGQGDAILIKTPADQDILIDGGPDEVILQRLGREMGWFDRKIDLLLLTHPHADHVTGLIEVLRRYQVDKIIYTGVIDTTPNFLAWLDTIKKEKIDLLLANHYQKINLGEDLYLEILYPFTDFSGKYFDNLNNSSIVARLVYGQERILFMGDAESEVEKILLEKYDMRAQVLKVGHHGSKTTSWEFLKAVKPEISIISVGKDNQFGHPAPIILQEIEKLGSKLFRTDLDGTIRIYADKDKLYY
jgi:competence protein ComEC